MRTRSSQLPAALCAALLAASAPLAQSAFVNWESSHVHPLELVPELDLLLAVDTADARLEVFDVTSGVPVPLRSIPVGLDPVSVRARPGHPGEAWVVNHISDTVSVVDLAAGSVVATLQTDDEPCDVAFAGSPQRAFVSCSQVNALLVFDPAARAAPPLRVELAMEEPRALAASADGARVYAASFESGNATTILQGGNISASPYPPNAVNEPLGPYGGVNPPPNDGAGFAPPIAPSLPPPPAVGLIVRKDAQGAWRDENGADWTALVSGPQAHLSGRSPGWDMPDRDVAVVDAATLAVTYAARAMNVCASLSVNPGTGEVVVVGTEAINEVRFEPRLRGIFVRSTLARVDPLAPATLAVLDLNPHLTYLVPSLPQSERNLALGDPRDVAWSPDGALGFVAGMGSNNVLAIDASGARAATRPIEVGQGPTGLVLDAERGALFVLNRFEATISTVPLALSQELTRTPFHDATPAVVRAGRRHLYDTHETSGLGQASCASCHVDARFDRLGWDLGDPSGAMKSIAGQNLFFGLPNPGVFEDWHPMKGPMTTQTLQDIVGKEPLHWRGDRNGLEEFDGAFPGLLGDDGGLSPAEMQEFEDMLASVHYPPNPRRNLDNTLSDQVDLAGHYSTGRYSPVGTPLPAGDAQRGLVLFRPPNFIAGPLRACSTCHTFPTGVGSHESFQGFQMKPLPPGPGGEVHTSLVGVDGFTNVTLKVSQLRNLQEKLGYDTIAQESLAGFGLIHDGSIDTLERFISTPVFAPASDQDIADIVAFLLSFAGSDLPAAEGTAFEPRGPAGRDTHAAVGTQVTIAASPAPAGELALAQALLQIASAGKIGVVVHGAFQGEQLGWTFLGGDQFQSSSAAVVHSLSSLLAGAAPGSELTFTAVPKGSEVRLGTDRDLDGFLDGDEVAAGSDPADAASIPCVAGPPPAPLALVAAPLGAHAIELTWTDGGGAPDELTVERRAAAAGAAFAPVASLPPGATGFVDGRLPSQSKFFYRVRAVTCGGSAVSGTASAVTAFDPLDVVERNGSAPSGS